MSNQAPKGFAGAPRQSLIAALRRQMAEAAAMPGAEAIALGISELDACLPKGGLAPGALHEVAPSDYRAMPSAWGFLLALAAQILRRRAGSVVWPVIGASQSHCGALYAPGLQAFGLDPDRILVVRCRKGVDALWAMEEALRHGASAVIGMRPHNAALTVSRRLQLAAEQSGTPVLLLRGHDDTQTSAAVTRWRVAPCPAARDRFGFFARSRWHVCLEHVRNGRTGEWVVEWEHEALRLRLPAVLGDGEACRRAA